MANRIVLNPVSYHGAGAVKEIGGELSRRGFKRAFIASGRHVVKSGEIKKITDVLDEIGVAYTFFTDIKPNPSIENVQNGVKAFQEFNADCIIAVGGGSVMDTSKAIGIIVNNPEFADVRSLEGVAPTKNHAVFTIAVPTTAGTAAEVTINYVITDVEKKRKFVCVDVNDIPEVAVVDPEMMYSMPKPLTAATGMDALTHAIEGFITAGAWELSDMFHLKAIQMIAKNLRGAVNGEPEGREAMALAQYVAGMGFSNVGLGVDHSMAHTLSAYYGMPHGKACATLLPTVMAYNAPVTGEKYRDIAAAFGVEDAYTADLETARAEAVAAVKKLGEDVGIVMSLKDVVPMEDVDALSADALKDACTPGNPRPVTVEDIKEMFLSLMK